MLSATKSRLKFF